MTVFLLIFFLLLTAYGWLVDYYRRSWNALPVFEPNPEIPAVKVSVVVAVRDEAMHIEQLLDYLSLQDYPSGLMEVIIVDDHSSDKTGQLAKTYFDRLRMKYLHLPAGVTSKKKALEAGIEEAEGELIVTTDADCTMGPAWLSTMVSFYVRTDAVFIAAPVVMQAEWSVLGIFQSLDFLTLQGITGASVYKEFHTMCNGANLAYTRKVFKEVNGFEGIDHLPSGDDMLLMHKIYSLYPERVYYLKNKNAVVVTAPEAGWKNFFHQRIRWASKAVHYRDKRIFYALLITYLVNVCFLVLGIASFFDLNWLFFSGLFLLAKIIIEFPFVNAVALFFGFQRLMKYFPFLQPLHILYTIIAGWLGRFGSYTWKSRVIKNQK